MKPININGVTEYWLRFAGSDEEAGKWRYKPAILVECTINFRSLRAGLNHSEERNYTAWISQSDMAIDWDSPATPPHTELKMQLHNDSNLAYVAGNYLTTANDLEQYEGQLIEELIRKERLRIYFNPVFGLFSAPEDGLQDFLSQVAEAALSRIEPELIQLRRKFELQIEQIRESHCDREVSAEELSDTLITRNMRFFESENRLTEMFSTLAGSVFGATKPRRETESFGSPDDQLREDLERVEQEASNALRALYEEYLLLANEYDIFEIGLQPDNLQVIRRALLWIPVAE
jgi:hypothetical protein